MTSRSLGVLFVCYANLVRSPLAAGIFSELVRVRGLQARFRVDSAGVAADAGYAPHPGSVAVAAAHGIELTGMSRPLRRADFYDFDHVLVLDRLVGSEIQRLLAGGLRDAPARVRLLASLAEPGAQGLALDVPDPIRGGPEGFAAAFAQISRACVALLDELSPETGS